MKTLSSDVLPHAPSPLHKHSYQSFCAILQFVRVWQCASRTAAPACAGPSSSHHRAACRRTLRQSRLPSFQSFSSIHLNRCLRYISQVCLATSWLAGRTRNAGLRYLGTCTADLRGWLMSIASEQARSTAPPCLLHSLAHFLIFEMLRFKLATMEKSGGESGS